MGERPSDRVGFAPLGDLQLTDCLLERTLAAACKILTEKIYLEVSSCYVALACCLLRYIEVIVFHQIPNDRYATSVVTYSVARQPSGQMPTLWYPENRA